jgi:hypothetical protein
MATSLAHLKPDSSSPDKTADPLEEKKHQALAKIAAGKRELKAYHAAQRQRVQQLRQTEELRLGHLAYAAGLAGADTSFLEKEFAETAAKLPVLTKEDTAC